jgi:predicted nucleotidyltransferase
MTTTAEGMSKEQLKRYSPFKSEKGLSASSEAIKVAALIARDLGKRYGAKKVVLFGSLLRSDQGPIFDIDLAVKGIPPTRFFKAVAFATGRSRKWKLDLIDIDDCGVVLRAIIEQEGVVLWPEREPSYHLES